MTGLYDWNEPFGRVVILRIGPPYKATFAVRSTREMALFLLDKWPGERTKTFADACQTCREAILGNIAPKRARAALIDAASEAGILDDLPFLPLKKRQAA